LVLLTEYVNDLQKVRVTREKAVLNIRIKSGGRVTVIPKSVFKELISYCFVTQDMIVNL